MRILIYNWRDIAHPYAGGAEVYTDRVASEWVKLGHEVTLFASSVDGCDESSVALGGYQVIRRGSRHTVYREARRFWRSQGSGNFDLVVDEVNTRPFLCPRFVKEAPVIALIHQVCREVWTAETRWPLSWIGRYVLEPLWLSFYRKVRVITVSESSRQSLHDYGLRDVVVVPEGVDSSESGDVWRKEDRPTLIFVGRLAASKRAADVLAVHRSLQRRVPDVQLWMIGGGPKEQELRSLAGEGVTFFGRCSEDVKMELLSRAHVLVATSVREGWGLVITEAAQMGTISCSYDVPGLRDSVLASGGMLSGGSPECLANVVAASLEAVVAGRAWPRVSGVLAWGEVAGRILVAVEDLLFEPEASTVAIMDGLADVV